MESRDTRNDLALLKERRVSKAGAVLRLLPLLQLPTHVEAIPVEKQVQLEAVLVRLTAHPFQLFGCHSRAQRHRRAGLAHLRMDAVSRFVGGVDRLVAPIRGYFVRGQLTPAGVVKAASALVSGLTYIGNIRPSIITSSSK